MELVMGLSRWHLLGTVAAYVDNTLASCYYFFIMRPITVTQKG